MLDEFMSDISFCFPKCVASTVFAAVSVYGLDAYTLGAGDAHDPRIVHLDLDGPKAQALQRLPNAITCIFDANLGLLVLASSVHAVL
jgi:hypothetical protein